MAGLGTAMYNGVSGLRSFSTAISVVSDNIANAGTTAFKSNEIRFADLVSSYYSTISSFNDREGAGSYPLAILTDWGQGPMINTSKWSDMAINGEGFFVVRDAQGNNFYTRDGSFYVNANGELVNYLGYSLLDVGGNPITLDLDQYSGFVVNSNGEIYGIEAATGNMSTDPLATIGLVTFRDPNGLIRVGNNLYREGPNSGRQDPAQPGTNGLGTIMSYTIEGSNVDLSEELVNMVIYQANFNANSKVITTAADMLNTAVNIVR
ncbi:flagellar hook-basal body protein [Thermodesulforhabdus norvegica]|uniref:Flagellar hook protein FlgE n=1 Tax=Thermodesulforhabdus norvegica TaxID=39841 RepID=A0A1I4R6L1_9BACT|nr:flagellar hook basal-body protein [Thermodesulforhabdus norvegica]SFM47626.1 flagellar hook protein FlgE [Thermodesulforhabdus norvegica]